MFYPPYAACMPYDPVKVLFSSLVGFGPTAVGIEPFYHISIAGTGRLQDLQDVFFL
jgi:hypothetical protein